MYKECGILTICLMKSYLLGDKFILIGGYHLDVPVKVIHPDEVLQQFIDHFRKFNDGEDSKYEVAKLVDIFDHAYRYLL